MTINIIIAWKTIYGNSPTLDKPLWLGNSIVQLNSHDKYLTWIHRMSYFRKKRFDEATYT